jgi:hypothetical protein
MLRARLFRVAAVTLALVIVAVAALAMYEKSSTSKSRTDAELLLSELHELQIGRSTSDDVNKISAHHIHNRVYLPTDARTCSQADPVCYYDFAYQNTLLSLLYLAPRTGLGIRVQLIHNLVDVILIGITSGTGPRFISVQVMDGAPKNLIASDSFTVSKFSNNSGAIWVRMTTEASQEDRDRAYALGLSCLDRIGGCHSYYEPMPALAQRASRK